VDGVFEIGLSVEVNGHGKWINSLGRHARA
jgi:hypothetical protein